MSRLNNYYKEKVASALQEKYGYENPMQRPRLLKIILNMGLAEVTRDKSAIEQHLTELTLLAGQKAVPTKAKKSVSNFKLREGQVVGAKVTLRKNRMWDFFDRFNNIVAPRIRDFRGFSPKADGRGNYTLGIESQEIFPEVDLDAIKRPQGMHITFVTSAENDEECLALLEMLGLPLSDRPVTVTI